MVFMLPEREVCTGPRTIDSKGRGYWKFEERGGCVRYGFGDTDDAWDYRARLNLVGNWRMLMLPDADKTEEIEEDAVNLDAELWEDRHVNTYGSFGRV